VETIVWIADFLLLLVEISGFVCVDTKLH